MTNNIYLLLWNVPVDYLPALGSSVCIWYGWFVFRIFLRCARLFSAPEESVAPFNLFASKYINFKSDWMKVIVDHLKYIRHQQKPQRWRRRLEVCGCMSRLKVESPISLIGMDENIPRILEFRWSFYAFILVIGQLARRWRFFGNFPSPT